MSRRRRINRLTRDGRYRQSEDGVIEAASDGTFTVRSWDRDEPWSQLGATWLDADNQVGETARIAFVQGNPLMPVFFSRGSKPGNRIVFDTVPLVGAWSHRFANPSRASRTTTSVHPENFTSLRHLSPITQPSSIRVRGDQVYGVAINFGSTHFVGRFDFTGFYAGFDHPAIILANTKDFVADAKGFYILANYRLSKHSLTFSSNQTWARSFDSSNTLLTPSIMLSYPNFIDTEHSPRVNCLSLRDVAGGGAPAPIRALHVLSCLESDGSDPLTEELSIPFFPELIFISAPDLSFDNVGLSTISGHVHGVPYWEGEGQSPEEQSEVYICDGSHSGDGYFDFFANVYFSDQRQIVYPFYPCDGTAVNSASGRSKTEAVESEEAYPLGSSFYRNVFQFPSRNIFVPGYLFSRSLCAYSDVDKSLIWSVKGWLNYPDRMSFYRVILGDEENGLLYVVRRELTLNTNYYNVIEFVDPGTIIKPPEEISSILSHPANETYYYDTDLNFNNTPGAEEWPEAILNDDEGHYIYTYATRSPRETNPLRRNFRIVKACRDYIETYRVSDGEKLISQPLHDFQIHSVEAVPGKTDLPEDTPEYVFSVSQEIGFWYGSDEYYVFTDILENPWMGEWYDLRQFTTRLSGYPLPSPLAENVPVFSGWERDGVTLSPEDYPSLNPLDWLPDQHAHSHDYDTVQEFIDNNIDPPDSNGYQPVFIPGVRSDSYPAPYIFNFDSVGGLASWGGWHVTKHGREIVSEGPGPSNQFRFKYEDLTVSFDPPEAFDLENASLSSDKNLLIFPPKPLGNSYFANDNPVHPNAVRDFSAGLKSDNYLADYSLSEDFDTRNRAIIIARRKSDLKIAWRHKIEFPATNSYRDFTNVCCSNGKAAIVFYDTVNTVRKIRVIKEEDGTLIAENDLPTEGAYVGSLGDPVRLIFCEDKAVLVNDTNISRLE